MPKVIQVKCSYTKACVLPGPRLRMPGTPNHFCPTHMQTIAVNSTPGTTGPGIDFESPVKLDVGGESRIRDSWAVSRGVIAK